MIDDSNVQNSLDVQKKSHHRPRIFCFFVCLFVCLFVWLVGWLVGGLTIYHE